MLFVLCHIYSSGIQLTCLLRATDNKLLSASERQERMVNDKYNLAVVGFRCMIFVAQDRLICN